MNRLPRVLITQALAFAFVLCARAQTPAPRVVVVQGREETSAPRTVEEPGAEKARLEFEGLRFLSERDARKVLREQRAGVEGTFDYEPRRIENAAKVLKDCYTRYGFLDAKVEVREEPSVGPRLFILAVDEGARVRLEELRFEGVARVPEARLVEAAEKCLARISDRDDAETWREAYDYERLRYCMRDAGRVLFGAGFLKAKLDDPKVEAVEHKLRATVRVEEGTRYRYGTISVKGVTAFLPEQIVEMLDARAGEVADGRVFAKVLSGKLNDEYLDRGFLQYSYDVTPTFRQTPNKKGWGVADFRIDISEGKRFTVSSIRFMGNRLKTEDELRAALAVREGELFSGSRFQDGFERLSEIGAMGDMVGSSFNSWPNVEFKPDEENGLVAVVIRVDEVEYLTPPNAGPR